MCIMGGAIALAGTSDHFLNEGVPPPSLGTVCIWSHLQYLRFFSVFWISSHASRAMWQTYANMYFHYRKSWTYTYLRMTIYPIDFKAASFLNIYQTQKNINPDSTELRRDHWTSASNDFESQPECPAVRREGLIRALTFAPIILLNTFNLHGWVGKEGLWACRPSVGAGQATVRC